MGVNDRDKGATLYVRIPEQHKEDLQRVAGSLGLKVSHITRYAIKHYLYGVDVPGLAAFADPLPAPARGDGQEGGDD
jgi:hypothetical protein